MFFPPFNVCFRNQFKNELEEEQPSEGTSGTPRSESLETDARKLPRLSPEDRETGLTSEEGDEDGNKNLHQREDP